MRRPLSLAALVTLAACGFDGSGLPAGSVIRDDTSADFSAQGSTLDGVEVRGGLISPAAWITGAGLVKGANSELFTDPSTVDWNTLDANTAARVALSAPLGDYGGGAPPGVGITQTDGFTWWLSGEVWLEAGLHQFSLAADDNGIVDLAQPGGTFTRVASAQWFSGAGTGTFSAPTDGWYPIHMAMSEGNGNASYQLQHQPPGATGLAPFDTDRLRASATSQQGIVADAFDDFYLVRPVGRSLFATSLLEQDFGAATPTDSGITASPGYSFHWAAQVRVDVGGDYALTLDTADGARLRLDGALVLDNLTGNQETHTTPSMHLDPGWHDVVIDFTSYSGAAHAKLHVASGPDLVGGPFPPDRVRPVIPRVDRVAGTHDDNDLAWQQGGTVSYMLAPPIPPGAIVDGVDVEYTLIAGHARDLEVDVIAPDLTVAAVRPPNGTDRTGGFVERYTTHALDGKNAAGTWQIQVTDKSGVDGGTTKDSAITVHYTGGHAPIAAMSAYESAPHDLGGPSRLDEVDYSASTPPGTSVVVRLRTGTSADDLMAQPWSDPVTSGQPPIVGAGQLVQYRVELTSDGDHSPSLDWIELVYRATN